MTERRLVARGVDRTRTPHTEGTWSVLSRPAPLRPRVPMIVAGEWQNADGTAVSYECRADGDDESYACTHADGRPLLNTAPGCRTAELVHEGERVELRAWMHGDLHVGYEMFDARGERIAAYDLNHTWADPLHVRADLSRTQRVAVEMAAQSIGWLWDYDMRGYPPFACEELAWSRRYPR